MLFGRKKPGFTDDRKNNESQKESIEKLQDQEKSVEELSGEEKVDFLDYLDELNEEDDLSSIEVVEEVDERPSVEVLADFIRDRSQGSYLTSKSSLKEEDEELEELIKELKEDESCKDIESIKGDKDVYFYSSDNMSDNYAMIALFVEEENLPKTIAKMVRWNAKTYPCPTPIYYFKRSPYNYSEEQIENAVEAVKRQEEYSDIGELITGNDVRYLYSTIHMSEKYARALAERVEYGEYGYLQG